MKKRRKTDQCLNCGLVFEVPDEFCPRCGQENHQKVKSVRMFLVDSFNDVLDIDSRFYRSVFPFLFKPGLLTNEYINGKRKRFVQPIRVYLVFSFIYFFASSLEVNKLTNQKELKSKIKNTTISDQTRRTRDSIQLSKLMQQHYKVNPATIADSLKKHKFSPRDSQYLASINAGFEAMYVQKKYRDSLRKVKRDSLVYHKRMKRLNKRLAKYRDRLANTESEKSKARYEAKLKRALKDSTKTAVLYQLKANQRQLQDSLKRYASSSQLKVRFTKMLTEVEVQLDSIRNNKAKRKYEDFEEGDDVIFGINIQRVGELSSLGFDEKKIMDSLDIERSTINRLIVHQTIRWNNASIAQLISYAVEKLPIVMFFVLPIFALLLKLFYIRRKRFYVEHIIFTLHIHAFAYLIFTFGMLFLELIPSGIVYVLSATFLLLTFYIYKSFRNVYRQGRFKTVVKMGLVGFVYLFILIFTFTLGVIVSLLFF